MTAPIRYGEVIQLSPLVRRVTQHNPGLFAGPGTNTHLVGDRSIVVLDPGEDLGDGHLERIVAAVAGSPVTAVIPSHGHPDHWPLAPKLAKALGAPVWFFGSHGGFQTDRSLLDGDRIGSGSGELEVLYTPGHTRDHLSFLLPSEAALFPGDTVMGWSTSIIAPPDGDLHQYLGSLDRLVAIPGLAVLYPAHGEAITSPYRRIAELRSHRQLRTRQALEALAAGPAEIPQLVRQIYREVDPALHPAAAQSLLTHLLALEGDGVVERIGDGAPESSTWRLRKGGQ